MKKTIAILALAAVGITAANARVRFGINVGIPVPAAVVVAPAPVVVSPHMPAPIVGVAPACPVPGYVWVVGSFGMVRQPLGLDAWSLGAANRSHRGTYSDKRSFQVARQENPWASDGPP